MDIEPLGPEIKPFELEQQVCRNDKICISKSKVGNWPHKNSWISISWMSVTSNNSKSSKLDISGHHTQRFKVITQLWYITRVNYVHSRVSNSLSSRDRDLGMWACGVCTVCSLQCNSSIELASHTRRTHMGLVIDLHWRKLICNKFSWPRGLQLFT